MEFNNIHKSYIARFFRDLSFFGAVSVPYFLDWLQVDYTRIFILEAWFIFWIVLLEIPTGVIADKYGRNISLGLGALFFAIDLFMFGTTKNYYVLYLAEFLGALGYALTSGADKAFIYDSLIDNNLVIKNGFIVAPDQPGLGTILLPSLFKENKYSYRASCS